MDSVLSAPQTSIYSAMTTADLAFEVERLKGLMDLMENGKCNFASTCALAFSDDAMLHFMDNINFFRDKLLMRPFEISNHPEVVRRIGLIAMNTALECDIFGNVNSTHVNGSYMMNGIGGSGDFARNGYLSIFLCPSIQKGGADRKSVV